MYLIVFTRKRLAPLVRRLSPLVPFAAAVVLIGLAAAVVWLQYESAVLRRNIAQLAGRISGYEQQLAEARPSAAAAADTLGAEILIDLHIPAGIDTLAEFEPESSTTGRGRVFAIQLASLHDRSEALQVANGLAATVPRQVLIQQAVLASGNWYRVLIEPFPDSKRAEAFADSLAGQGIIRDYVLQRLPAGWQTSPDYSAVPKLN